MEQGLAAQVVYGDGEGQNTTHYYVNTPTKGKKKKKCTKKRQSTK